MKIGISKNLRFLTSSSTTIATFAATFFLLDVVSLHIYLNHAAVLNSLKGGGTLPFFNNDPNNLYGFVRVAALVACAANTVVFVFRSMMGRLLIAMFVLKLLVWGFPAIDALFSTL